MKFDIIIQARYQSTRLPGKILLNFDGTNFLEFLIKNLKRIKSINRIIIITPKDEYLKIFSEISKNLVEGLSMTSDVTRLLYQDFY